MQRLLDNYRRTLTNHESILSYAILGIVAGVASGLTVLATGQSGGREGPCVHLGAAINSKLGQWLGLPNNSLRGLIACGTAGGIAAATLTNTGISHQRSAHQSVLKQLRRLVPNNPLNQLLHRTHVSSSMEISVVEVPILLLRSTTEPLLMATPTWCLVERDTDPLFLIRGRELAEWLNDNPFGEEQVADLSEANIRRWSISDVPIQATLQQTMDSMRADTAEAACIYGRNSEGKRVLQGIVT